MKLLQEYVEYGSEAAFATLVSRHINKVYSVALRHTRNPHQAEEITQAVFVILARKSSHLGKGVVLAGWLCQTARLTALTFIRGEIRRTHREQEAHMQTLLNDSESDIWPQIAPFLDTAMAGLNKTDYHAVVLRYFDGKSMKEVGAALGASEDAAKTRVNRAVGKLRKFFSKRGIVLPAAVLMAAISANSVQAAPAALVKTVTVAAFTKGAVGGSTLTLVKGALKVMAWTKMKTALVVGVAVILATGTTTTIIVEHHKQVLAHRPAVSNLPTLTQNETLTLQADGTIQFQMDVDEVNTGNKPLKTYQFLNSDFMHVDRLLDADGQSVAFTIQHSNKMFRYTVTLNSPIPPGGKITGSMEGTITGLIQPTGEPGVFEYSMDHWPGYGGNTRRVEVHDLPPGAVLLEKTPADLVATTNGNQVELRVDRIIPPGGDLNIRYRYRLAEN